MLKYFILLSCITWNLNVLGQNNESFNKFCDIIGRVESNNNDLAKGDGGKAIGRYQIWRVCYLDAKEFNKNITFPYKSLTNKENSKIILKSYLMKYCPEAVKNNQFEIMARTWNGGPTGYKKQSTLKYWKKLKKELDK